MPLETAHRVRRIELIDTHSGGDVSRIVLAGVGALPGDTVREQMRYLEAHGDGLRRLILSEPYGDPHMSVNLVIPPCHPEAEAGFSLTRDEEAALSAFGDAFIRAARPQFVQEHPDMGDEGALAFMHLMGPVEPVGTEDFRSRSATYVHPGVSNQSFRQSRCLAGR